MEPQQRLKVSAAVMEGLAILGEGVRYNYFSEEFLTKLYGSVVYFVGQAGLDSLEQIPPDDRRADHNELRDSTRALVDEIEREVKWEDN